MTLARIIISVFGSLGDVLPEEERMYPNPPVRPAMILAFQ
jgi:hypothetical protein